MAVFKYRLQNVLDVKLKMEDQAKAAFAEANARLSEEEAIRDALIERREAYEEEGRRLRFSTLNVKEIRDNTVGIDNIKEQIVNQELEVEKARRGVESARRVLAEAMQERKIHEKLKENKFEEFMRDINAAESKEIDELVSYTYGERIRESEENG